ncbi:MAG: FAD-binding protein [Bryobacteraceae bacterium]|nr:FAD-binding protein [Bryobacteraceae bacterium]
MKRLEPDSPAAVAEALSQASRDRHVIETGGAFTKTRAGGPRAEAGVALSTAKLDRVLTYEPRDLTISVEAGMPFAKLSALLAEHGQMIPLDPPFAAQATIGGVIAANSSGPRRRWFGTARDLVIGMQYATMEGKLVQSGGMVVKNVAGLDTGKLHIGALGTLGVITVLNFKLLPMPVGTRTFARAFPTAAAALAERDRILRSQLQPLALDFLNPAAARTLGLTDFVLLLEAGGEPPVLDRYARELPGFDVLDGQIWARVNSFTESFLAAHPGGGVLRVSTKLTESPAFDEPMILRAGNGVAYVYFATLPTALPPLKCVVEYGPETRPAGATLWPGPVPGFDLMRRVKEMMDPLRLLNPGRLYGRL